MSWEEEYAQGPDLGVRMAVTTRREARLKRLEGGGTEWARGVGYPF